MNLPPEPDSLFQDPVAPLPASPTPPAETAFGDLQRSIHALRRLFHITLAALILALAALNVYLFSQVRALRYQAADLSRHAKEMSQAVQDYETNSVPVMEKLTAELHRFAESHPDFAPVMARYPKASAPARPAAPRQTAPPPAPAAQPVRKK